LTYLKYSLAFLLTFGANTKPEIIVGIAIKAKALSIRLIAKSILTTAAITIKII